MDCSLHGGCVVTSADWHIYHAIRARADLSSPRVLETGLAYPHKSNAPVRRKQNNGSAELTGTSFPAALCGGHNEGSGAS